MLMFRKRDGGRFRRFARCGAGVRDAGKSWPHARLAGDGGALPFTPAALVRPGMVMFDEHGGYDVVESVERVELDAPVYDLDIERTHNFIANGIVTHNSIYGFRGADIRNILEFEDTFPDAHVVKLEQNYRSTQTILDAANAVIRNNRGQKPKSLWTELGQGDPIKVRELEDEHAEARFVTGEIQRLLDEGVSRAEVAVFYRTNAQSRVLQDTLVRGGHPLPGDRRHQVLRARRDQGRDRLSDHARQPPGRRRVHPDRQLAAARDRLDLDVAAAGLRQHDGDIDLGRGLRARAGAGTRARPAVKAFRRFMATMHVLRERAETNPPIAELLKEVLQETGYLEALEAERTIEAQGRIENLEELVNVAVEYDALTEAEPEREASLADFLEQVALISDADDRSDDEGLVTLMTLHNAKGLEYPIVFMIGLRGGGVPALARARRGRPRGGAAALLRGHHPRPARPVPHLRPHAQRVRRPQLRRPEPVHRRDPRRADRPRAAAAARAGRRSRAGDLVGSERGETTARRGTHPRRRPRRRSGSARTSPTRSSARGW